MEESNYQVRGNWGHGSLGPKFSEFKETKRNKNSLEKKCIYQKQRWRDTIQNTEVEAVSRGEREKLCAEN